MLLTINLRANDCHLFNLDMCAKLFIKLLHHTSDSLNIIMSLNTNLF